VITLVENERFEKNDFREKYLLARKDQLGHYRKIHTFNEPPTPEDALRNFGPGRYILRKCLPRFKTLWKSGIGDNSANPNKQDLVATNIQKLDSRTKYLGYGLIGSFGTQALGFGLSHLRFSQIEDRIARVETALRSLPVQELACTLCSTPILTMLQESCAGCGSPIEWAKNNPTENSTSRRWFLP
jgi:hypothetical protein